MDLKRIILLLGVILTTQGCSHQIKIPPSEPLVGLSEESVSFSPGCAIKSDPSPSMEEIVLSIGFLDAEARLDFNRSAFGDCPHWWEGRDWIQLIQGDGDFGEPIAIEKIEVNNRLFVKIIYWRRYFPPGFKGSLYDYEWLRYEYRYALEESGWRKIERTIKSGVIGDERVYLDDERNVDPNGKGRLLKYDSYQ
jgi:hypothetical protein